MEQFRQGDVIITRVPSIPKGLREQPRDNGRIVLAYGEVTGHAHAILDRDVTAFRDPKLNALFLKVDQLAELRHEEHGTIELPPGNYEVRRQREYDPKRDRFVAD